MAERVGDEGPGAEQLPEGRGNPSKGSGREQPERDVLEETHGVLRVKTEVKGPLGRC